MELCFYCGKSRVYYNHADCDLEHDEMVEALGDMAADPWAELLARMEGRDG